MQRITRKLDPMSHRYMRCSKTCLFVLENMFGMGLMDGKYYIGELAYPLDSAVKASLVLEDSAFAGKREAVYTSCPGNRHATRSSAYKICFLEFKSLRIKKQRIQGIFILIQYKLTLCCFTN